MLSWACLGSAHKLYKTLIVESFDPYVYTGRPCSVIVQSVVGWRAMSEVFWVVNRMYSCEIGAGRMYIQVIEVERVVLGLSCRFQVPAARKRKEKHL